MVRSASVNILCDKALILLKQGRSIQSISKELNKNAKTLSDAMKLRFPLEFEEYVHGKIIAEYNGIPIHKIPDNHTNRTDCNKVKNIKKAYIAKGYVEEAGVWIGGSRITVDLFNPITMHAIEITNHPDGNAKHIIARLERYKKYFSNCSSILVGYRPIIKMRILNAGFDCVDTGFDTLITLPGTFPLTEASPFGEKCSLD